MGLRNVLRAYLAYKKDKKAFPETIDRDIIDLHIRDNFEDFTEILSNHYSKKREFVIFTGTTKTKEFGERILKVMNKENYTAELRPVKVDIPSVKLAKKIASDFDHRIPIGVGGGSILDLAKLVGKEVGNKSISVPTALSHDGIASPIASCLKDGKRTSLTVLRPSPTYANLGVIKKVRRLNVAGMGDALSNYTAIRDWRNSAYKKGKNKVKYSKWSAFFSTVTFGYWLRREIKKEEGKLTDDMIDLLIGSHFFSGILMEVAGSSAPCSGAEHLLSHALDKLYPNKDSLHGEQVGMLSVPVACLQSKWFRKFGIRSRDSLQIRKCLEIIGAPSDFKELGLKDLSEKEIQGIFHLARKMGKRKGRSTVLDHINVDQFKSALTNTGVWIR